jgi:hypothetical protein
MMLGVAKLSLGKLAEAEPLLDQCLSIRRALFGASHPQVGLALMNLATVYEKTAREAEATVMREQARRMGVDSMFAPQA